MIEFYLIYWIWKKSHLSSMDKIFFTYWIFIHSYFCQVFDKILIYLFEIFVQVCSSIYSYEDNIYHYCFLIEKNINMPIVTSLLLWLEHDSYCLTKGISMVFFLIIIIFLPHEKNIQFRSNNILQFNLKFIFSSKYLAAQLYFLGIL